MIERATWWVSPGLLRNSNDLSGYVCNMSPGGCFTFRVGKKSIYDFTLVDASLSGVEKKLC